MGLRTYQEGFIEPLQWAQFWTLCHGRAWKKPLDLRFRLWDTCFAIWAIITPCSPASSFWALIQGPCACSLGQSGFGTSWILQLFSIEKADLGQYRKKHFPHCLHAFLQEGNHTYLFLSSYAPKQVNEGSPLSSFIITAFGMLPKTGVCLQQKKKVGRTARDTILHVHQVSQM